MPLEGWVRLPSYVLDEIRSIAYHLPLYSCNLRRSLYASLLATDATPVSGGSTRARITKPLARQLFDRSVCKRSTVRLDGSDGIVRKERGALRSEFVDSLGTQLRWHVSKAYRFKRIIAHQSARASGSSR